MATFISDLKTHAAGGASVRPVVISSATTTNGTGVDLLEADGFVNAHLSVGTLGGSSMTVDVHLEESADNSTFTDISGATFTQLDEDDDNAAEWIVTNLRAARYVRAVVVTAGTVSSVPIAVHIWSQKKITGTGDGAQVT